MHEKNKGEGKVFFIRKLCLILELPLLLLQNCHVYISRYRCRSRYKGRIRFIRYKRSRYRCRGRYKCRIRLICRSRRGQRISKGGGRDFKCCCVQENFEKLTLSGAFSDHFFRKGGGGRGTAAPPSDRLCLSV